MAAVTSVDARKYEIGIQEMVILKPCDCRIQKIVAVLLYDAPVHRYCPLCKPQRVVLRYEVEESEESSVPFPGKAAKFIRKEGNWTPEVSINLRRRIEFVSEVADSLFNGISIWGYADLSVTIVVSFDGDKSTKVNKYFRDKGLTLDACDWKYCTKNREDLKKIFNILTKNGNQFPAVWLPLLKRLTDVGEWTERLFESIRIPRVPFKGPDPESADLPSTITLPDAAAQASPAAPDAPTGLRGSVTGEWLDV